MSSKRAILSRGTVQWINCFDSCQLTIARISITQRCTYGNGATILFFKVLGLAYGGTHWQSRDNQLYLVIGRVGTPLLITNVDIYVGNS